MRPDPVARALLALLTRSAGAPARLATELPEDAQRATLQSATALGAVERVEVANGRFFACRFHHQQSAIVAIGPYRRSSDPPGAARMLSADDEARVSAALAEAAAGLGQALDDQRQRLELATQMEVVSRAVLAVTGELELETVLRHIVDLARELSGAQYAALGVPDQRGELTSFVTSGLSAAEEARIGSRPHGHGILGLLLREPRTIRMPDLTAHPASVGFPANHPPMRSFLGVPVVARGRVVGNLYLTEKRGAAEFSAADARVVELLARHAGVAIENARLYAALEDQQRRLHIIVDQLPEAVLIAEPDPDRVTLANPQASKLLGWEISTPAPLDAFLARNPRAGADHAPLAAGAIPLVRSLHDGVVHQRVEVRIMRPDGTEITCLANSVPLRDEAGRVSSSLAVFQDISQIKDAEQLKDDFLSLVSHELRTPLTTIQGGALLLRRDWARLDSATQGELLADISTESRRLAILIENMVQLANIRAGRLRMQTEPAPVGPLLAEAVEALRQLAPERPFRLDSKPRLIADADPGRLDQIVRNLLHNAVKYSPADSAVDVTARRAGELIEIAVRDRGPGISEEAFPFVFERYRRSERAVASGAPGMGLGLYLSRHVVEAHGGRIWIERPEDGGTRVVFTVPADEDAGDA